MWIINFVLLSAAILRFMVYTLRQKVLISCYYCWFLKNNILFSYIVQDIFSRREKMEVMSAAFKLRRFSLMSVGKLLFFAAFLCSKNVNFHHIKIKMFLSNILLQVAQNFSNKSQFWLKMEMKLNKNELFIFHIINSW